MKRYSRKDLVAAYEKSPAPIQHFAGSPTFQQIVKGMRAKHTLTDDQEVALTFLVNLTLVGLEQESSFETNLHQVLPELAHATAHELVLDAGTRVFKEARRRIEENVLEPSAFLDVEKSPIFPGLDDKEYIRINNLDDDDPEAVQIHEKEVEEERARAAEDAARLAKEPQISEEDTADPEPGPFKSEADFFETLERVEKDPEIPLPPISSYEMESQNIESEPETPVPSPQPGIPLATKAVILENTPARVAPIPEPQHTLGPLSALAKEKLSAPRTSAPQQISVAPTAPPAPPVTQSPAQPYKTNDPYRESLD